MTLAVLSAVESASLLGLNEEGTRWVSNKQLYLTVDTVLEKSSHGLLTIALGSFITGT